MSDFEIAAESGPNSLEGNPTPGTNNDSAIKDADTSDMDFFMATNLIALPPGDVCYPDFDVAFSTSDKLMEVQDELSSETIARRDIAKYPQRVGRQLDFPAKGNIPAIADDTDRNIYEDEQELSADDDADTIGYPEVAF
jgi:hypothetical protein